MLRYMLFHMPNDEVSRGALGSLRASPGDTAFRFSMRR